MFIDRVTLTATGGRGGDGCVSFRREPYVPRGGPDGGCGGPGGDVILRADPSATTLIDYQFAPQVKAKPGQHAKGKNKTGATGADVVCRVPVGTQVYDAASGKLLTDLMAPGQEFVAAAGGRGGRGNVSFASARNPAPRRRELGAPGEERELRLELKILADLGLVGLPNAGKSTLLRAISKATPAVAAYPFTTKHPILGIVRDELSEAALVVADLPGLIAGAHQGRGMGIQFLKHIERTRLVLHLVEGQPLDTLGERYKVIRDELDCYGHGLMHKPQVVVVTKADLLDATERKKAVATLRRRKVTPLVISAQDGTGMAELRARLFALAQEHPRPAVEQAPEPVRITLPPDQHAVRVSRTPDGDFLLVAPWLEQRLAVTDFANEEALAAFQRIMEKRGVSDALRAKGCKAGDTVVIGDREFVFCD